ncbi:MAG: hypothetical protein GY820_48340 [Gammaproteobacteria bacterium]|nr:hypothetical protein [Gammaproteobacteria bacterium]
MKKLTIAKAADVTVVAVVEATANVKASAKDAYEAIMTKAEIVKAQAAKTALAYAYTKVKYVYVKVKNSHKAAEAKAEYLKSKDMNK